MRPLAGIALAVLAALAAYLFLWPVPIEPAAWKAPRAPKLEGRYAVNDALSRLEELGRGEVLGPEATAVDGAGRVYTGVADGRILRLDPARGTFETVISTGGRPLGLAFGPDGTLYLCDAHKGLMALSPGGALRTLAAGHGGVPFRLPDDVDVGPDGTVYFTDASHRFGIDQVREDVLEHRGAGRLLAWRPATGATELLLDGLQFANGVAVSGDGSYLLVVEMWAYRLTRYWLAGPRRGTSEAFIENLPGLPDNVTFSRPRGVFWVALYSPRVGALDVLAPYPALRKAVLRLPMWLQPQPARHALVLALDGEGRVVANLQHRSPQAFAPVTSAREHGGWLWLGSLTGPALGRVRVP